MRQTRKWQEPVLDEIGKILGWITHTSHRHRNVFSKHTFAQGSFPIVPWPVVAPLYPSKRNRPFCSHIFVRGTDTNWFCQKRLCLHVLHRKPLEGRAPWESGHLSARSYRKKITFDKRKDDLTGRKTLLRELVWITLFETYKPERSPDFIKHCGCRLCRDN